MATKYEYFDTPQDPVNNQTVTGIFWWGQTFTPSTTHSIFSVKLLVKKEGTPGDITVSIRLTSGGFPTGEDLIYKTLAGSSLSTDYGWVEFVFNSSYLVVSGTEYAILVREPDGVPYNYLMWQRGLANTYTDGQEFDSYDSGGTWEALPNNDMMFEEYGAVLYPTDAITRVTNLIHRYNRNTNVYTLEMALGEVTTDFGLPEWLTRPQPAVPEVELPPVVPGGPPTAWPPRPGEEVTAIVDCPYCGQMMPWNQLFEHMQICRRSPKATVASVVEEMRKAGIPEHRIRKILAQE